MENLQAVILVIHLICTVALIVLILVQPSEAGGFMGGAGSMSNLSMAPRRTADTMTRLTTTMAGLFFTTSMILAIVASHRPTQHSIFDAPADVPARTIPAGPVPAAPVPDKGKVDSGKADQKTDVSAPATTNAAAKKTDHTDQDKKKKDKSAPKAPETE